MKFTIQKAAPAHQEAILALLTAAFTEEQGIPAQLIPLPPERGPQWWCAFSGREVVGVAAAWQEGKEIHWGRFAVRRDCRRKGIGMCLIRRSMEDLFAQGIEEARMEARETTAAMICSLGGAIAGQPVPFYKGTVTPVLLRRQDYH